MAGYMNLSAIPPGSVTKLSTKDTRGTVTGIYNTVQFKRFIDENNYKLLK